ncbi:unnamed protein product [Prorocentrum cordatum]|uniref:WWE domain-containing protein n=1 Tax=Prorocentrum cordatum TaxID=2364126 RepID=A0ABN9XQW5_9DINO|nr:unnamed protein product [Polarella glacialis]
MTPRPSAESPGGAMEGAAYLAGGEGGRDGDQAVVRWQYLFEDSYMFDSTIPGWHSFGREDAANLESAYQAMDSASSEPCLSRLSAGGYRYEVDVRGMVQRNLQTGKSRAVRRAEFRYQSQVVEDGGSFVLEARLRGGQEVSWAWEVQGDRGDSLDFRADFAADSAAGSLLPWGAAETLARGSQSEHAWSYAARGAGRLRLCWSSPRSWSAAAPRVLLVECWRGAATEEVAGLPCAAEWLAAAGVAEPAGDGEVRRRERHRCSVLHRHDRVRLEVLVRARPRRGPASGGTGIGWCLQRRQRPADPRERLVARRRKKRARSGRRARRSPS